MPSPNGDAKRREAEAAFSGPTKSPSTGPQFVDNGRLGQNPIPGGPKEAPTTLEGGGGYGNGTIGTVLGGGDQFGQPAFPGQPNGSPYPQSWIDTYNQQSPGTQAAIGARYGGMDPRAIAADWNQNVASQYAPGTSAGAILGGAPTGGGLQGLIGGPRAPGGFRASTGLFPGGLLGGSHGTASGGGVNYPAPPPGGRQPEPGAGPGPTGVRPPTFSGFQVGNKVGKGMSGGVYGSGTSSTGSFEQRDAARRASLGGVNATPGGDGATGAQRPGGLGPAPTGGGPQNLMAPYNGVPWSGGTSPGLSTTPTTGGAGGGFAGSGTPGGVTSGIGTGPAPGAGSPGGLQNQMGAYTGPAWGGGTSPGLSVTGMDPGGAGGANAGSGGGGLQGLVQKPPSQRFQNIKAYQSDPSRGGTANWNQFKRDQKASRGAGWRDSLQ